VLYITVAAVHVPFARTLQVDHDVVVNRDSTAMVETAKVCDLRELVSANFSPNNVIMTHNHLRRRRT